LILLAGDRTADFCADPDPSPAKSYDGGATSIHEIVDPDDCDPAGAFYVALRQIGGWWRA
jgi:hypothetical protein